MTTPHGALLFPQQLPCRVVQARSFEYLDDELAEAERRAIDSHLARCADCRYAYDRDGAFRGFLRQAASIESAPASLRSRLVEALRRASDDTPA
jgi:mycothiol system anti-sigma-R factor